MFGPKKCPKFFVPNKNKVQTFCHSEMSHLAKVQLTVIVSTLQPGR